ncbi:MAG: A/G-specific adenine glycosylase [Acidobacteria bacterium]|nr:A/G-specific adenine glycosylase [Acidobacteriota bacterium]
MTSSRERKFPARKSQPAAHGKNQSAAAIRRALLGWYDRHRRDLPWRRTHDPYRIWISEVMLQQTRVPVVVPFYERFLRRFPTVEALAAADEQTLLACWSGLGYYSRARNLRKAAQVIVRQHGGRFPADLRAALELPGVGAYTAAAVLSIAYSQPLPVLDGNVARVLSRLFLLEDNFKTTSGKRNLCSRAQVLLSTQRPGDFNQALMELGATICLPQQPHCHVCPVRTHCLANRSGSVERFPLRQPKTSPVVRRFTVAAVRDKAGRYLLVQRPQTAPWMRGFWELPMWEVESNGLSNGNGLHLGRCMGHFRHSITSNRLEVAVFAAHVDSALPLRKHKWASLDRFHRLPVTTVTRKAVGLLRRITGA